MPRDPFPFADDADVADERSPGLRYGDALQFWLAVNAGAPARERRPQPVGHDRAA